MTWGSKIPGIEKALITVGLCNTKAESRGRMKFCNKVQALYNKEGSDPS